MTGAQRSGMFCDPAAPCDKVTSRCARPAQCGGLRTKTGQSAREKGNVVMPSHPMIERIKTVFREHKTEMLIVAAASFVLGGVLF